MLKLTESEKNFILQNIENGESLIKSDKLRELLLPLDALITAGGFDDNYDLNDFGRKAQNIYDDIYYNNTEE